MIKMVLLDIDGVMTDGKVLVNSQGEEYKTFCFKDFDAFSELRKRRLSIGAITGEQSPMVNYIKARVPWDYFYSGAKNKIVIMEEIRQKEKVALEEICYVGDGKYDITPLTSVGLAICPNDAIDEVKKVCDVVLSRKGGEGCVWELIKLLDQYNFYNCTPINGNDRKCHRHMEER
jgi:YrbI family 3-deoxy-D-manno-octulosonate 8-phosphate phosphatase